MRVPPLLPTCSCPPASCTFTQGLAKAIGVSNFSNKKLGGLLQGCRIRPAVHQVGARGVVEEHDFSLKCTGTSTRSHTHHLSFSFSISLCLSSLPFLHTPQFLHRARRMHTPLRTYAQVEVHTHFRNRELIEFNQGQGIHVTAYSPLGTPDSAGGWGCRLRPAVCAVYLRPPALLIHTLKPTCLSLLAGMMKRTPDWPIPLEDPTVKAIAAKLGKTPAQVRASVLLMRALRVQSG